jgi:hypothetical protein
MVVGDRGLAEDVGHQSDQDIDAEQEKKQLRRSKSRRRHILLIVLCAVVALLIIWPIISTLSLTESQKLIVTAKDIGPGWYTGSPEVVHSNASGPLENDTAHVRLENEQAGVSDGGVTLVMYASKGDANTLFLQESESMVDEARFGNRTAGNVTVGDRAVLISYYVDDGSDINYQRLVMQKGSALVWVYLIAWNGHTFDKEQAIEIAKIQAAKLP